MRIGAFNLVEPLPELRAPHALAVLRPWIDAGNVGTLAIGQIEAAFATNELGKIMRPGMFFDFTRYRPMARNGRAGREIIVPNSVITCAQTGKENDLIFIHLLEPHMFGELYVESILQLLRRLGVRRYCQIGSMYDMVPHTRPLPVTGGAVGVNALEVLKKAGIGSSNYEGPTSICSLISLQAAKLGMETMSVMVRLPQYTELEDDYMGQLRLLEMMQTIYGIPVEESVIKKAQEQLKDIDTAVNRSKKIKEVVTQLEAHYDAQAAARQKEEMPRLSSDVENFLKEMEKKFRQS